MAQAFPKDRACFIPLLSKPHFNQSINQSINQSKFISIAHFIHRGNPVCFT
uniref:Uncharacterized protein n=1 Tax=Anguilla anguilla TaxID=7936 RepID=A0A0E9W213_ANGAN